MHQLARIARMQIDIDTALAQQQVLNDYVYVQNGLADFPTPGVSNDIQLLANTVYQINGVNDIGVNHLVMGVGTIVLGMATQNDRLVTSTTGGAIRASGGNSIICNRISIQALSGAMFDGVDCPLVFADTVIGLASRYGRFEDCSTISLLQSACIGIDNANKGIELVNATPGARLAIVLSSFVQSSGGTGVLIDFGSSVWSIIACDQVELVSAVGGTDISGLTSNGNLVSTTGRGRFRGCIVNGAGTHIAGIDHGDTLWKFDGNTGLSDSQTIGTLVVNGNAAITAIVTQNAWVPLNLNNSAFLGSNAERFELADADTGRLRYIGIDEVHLQLNANFGVLTPGSQDYEIRATKNDAVLPDGIVAKINTDSATSTEPFSAPVSLVTNDELDWEVRNVDGEDNITIVSVSEFT